MSKNKIVIKIDTKQMDKEKHKDVLKKFRFNKKNNTITVYDLAELLGFYMLAKEGIFKPIKSRRTIWDMNMILWKTI